MRLWAKGFIVNGLLPDSQLKAQRYELGDMIKQYPNIKNRITLFANDYPIDFLVDYFLETIKQFDKRGFNHKESYDNGILSIAKEKGYSGKTKLMYLEEPTEILYGYFNLMEKYKKGQKDFSKEQFDKLTEFYEKEKIKQ